MRRNYRKISITLKIQRPGILSEMACFQHLSLFSMYIAVVKPITSICFLLIAVTCLPLNCTPVLAQTVPASVSNTTVSPTAKTVSADQPVETDGKLVVIVTWGDTDNTPATNVIIEALGYTHGLKSPSEVKSILLKASQDERYEASLQPGLYDVFVSEATSVPRCKRLQIKAGLTNYWTLKLEIDDVYMQK